jgi:hypothetical protein
MPNAVVMMIGSDKLKIDEPDWAAANAAIAKMMVV